MVCTAHVDFYCETAYGNATCLLESLTSTVQRQTCMKIKTGSVSCIFVPLWNRRGEMRSQEVSHSAAGKPQTHQTPQPGGQLCAESHPRCWPSNGSYLLTQSMPVCFAVCSTRDALTGASYCLILVGKETLWSGHQRLTEPTGILMIISEEFTVFIQHFLKKQSYNRKWSGLNTFKIKVPLGRNSFNSGNKQ